jgi:lipoprotein LprG
MNTRWIVSLIVALMLSASAVACMGDDDDDDSGDAAASPEASPTPVTAQTVLQAASQRWAELNSAHFVLAVEGDAFLDDDETLKLRSAEGDVKRPDSASATAKIEAMAIVVDVSLIGVGGTVYMTNLLSGEWEEAPQDFSYDPSVLFDDNEGIGAVLTGLHNPQLDGEDNVNGKSAYKVTGTVDAAAVEAITAGSILGEAIDITVWIGKDPADILKVTLTEPEGIREAPATWTLQLTEHNKEVTIEAPEI